MPFRVEVCSAEQLVRSTATGRVGLEDVQEYIRRARALGAHRYPGVIDVRRAESIAFTMRDLLSIARFASAEFDGAPVAPRAVVVGSARHFEWARIFSSLVAGWMSVGVFTDYPEAVLWLEHRTAEAQAAAPKAARRA